MREFVFAGGRLPLCRPYLWGIVNATPDSFSDGGEAPLPKLRQLVSAGADFLDLGAESTRPGAQPIEAAAEWRRLQPVLEEALTLGVPISVDTYHPETARAALSHGAAVLNTVCDITKNAALVRAAAEAGAGLIVTHNRPASGDVKEDMLRYFEEASALADACGMAAERLCFDIGIGFSKNTAESAAAFAAIPAVRRSFDCAVMLAHSRKRMVGDLFQIDEPRERDTATAALSALGALLGADFFRVHDPAATAAAIRKVAE